MIIPCKNCLIFPICKQTYLNDYGLRMQSIDHSHLSVYQLENYSHKLRYKCTLLKDYIHYKDIQYIRKSEKQLRKLYTFMKGIKQ